MRFFEIVNLLFIAASWKTRTIYMYDCNEGHSVHYVYSRKLEIKKRLRQSGQ